MCVCVNFAGSMAIEVHNQFWRESIKDKTHYAVLIFLSALCFKIIPQITQATVFKYS